MTRRAAGLYAVVIAGVIAFQALVATGAPWGEWTQGGGVSGPVPPGGRAFAVLSAVVLALFALGILGAAGRGPLSSRPRLARIIGWVAVGYGTVAVLLNAATPSARERALWLPVSIVLMAAALVAMLGSRRRRAPAVGDTTA
jgi:hypothetical protein